MFLGQRGDPLQKGNHLTEPLFKRKSLRHILRAAASEHDHLRPQRFGAGERGLRVLERARVVRGFARQPHGLGEEIVAGLAGDARCAHPQDERLKFFFRQRRHLGQRQFDVVVADRGDLFDGLNAGAVRPRRIHVEADAKLHPPHLLHQLSYRLALIEALRDAREPSGRTPPRNGQA